MQLTYATATKTLIQAILDDGEKIDQLEGPGVFFVKVDGNDAAFRDLLEQHDNEPAKLIEAIADPLATSEAQAAAEAAAAKKAEAAEEAKAAREAPADEDHPHRKKKNKH